jgi:SAM-dependent methyltransferase
MAGAKTGHTTPMRLRETAWDRFWSGTVPPRSTQPGGFTRWATPFLAASPAGDVVDLGCGPGRDLCFLLSQGFTVTGVDESSVAVSEAASAVARLPEATRARGRVVHAELGGFLRNLRSESVGAFHAAATYQSLPGPELQQAFDEIHRVLIRDGLHVWSVRSTGHPGASAPETVPPNLPGQALTVPLRFFSRTEVDALTGPRFERVAITESALRSFYVADRKAVHG